MKLFYIGRKFYAQSGTMMSSLYHEDKEGGDYYRSDWGKVESALERGEPVDIRPANDVEMLWAYRKLEGCR